MKHNPFSTRKTNPGIIPYYFGDVILPRESDSELFFDLKYTNFRKFDFRSQIIGGHGTGKTTFLFEFVRYLESQKHIVHHFTLHDGQRSLPREFWKRLSILIDQPQMDVLDKMPICVIDGYEQLSLTAKIRLRRVCRKGRSGLLITTHTPAWRLPVLLRTETTDATMQDIIGHLFRDLPGIAPPDKALCRSLFDHHQGNLRNVLFDLYDHYEESTDKASDFRLQASGQSVETEPGSPKSEA